VICGAETWEQLVLFGTLKQGFFKKIIELPNIISSKDTINSAFSVMAVNNLSLASLTGLIQS